MLGSSLDQGRLGSTLMGLSLGAAATVGCAKIAGTAIGAARDDAGRDASIDAADPADSTDSVTDAGITDAGDEEAGAACADSLTTYCAQQPWGCPTSADPSAFCSWLALRGIHSYGGPLVAGTTLRGWSVEGPAFYLFDDAGLAFVSEWQGPAGPVCVLGAAPSELQDFDVIFWCTADAGVN
jgi:hypothetical protein